MLILDNAAKKSKRIEGGLILILEWSEWFTYEIVCPTPISVKRCDSFRCNRTEDAPDWSILRSSYDVVSDAVQPRTWQAKLVCIAFKITSKVSVSNCKSNLGESFCAPSPLFPSLCFHANNSNRQNAKIYRFPFSKKSRNCEGTYSMLSETDVRHSCVCFSTSRIGQ